MLYRIMLVAALAAILVMAGCPESEPQVDTGTPATDTATEDMGGE